MAVKTHTGNERRKTLQPKTTFLILVFTLICFTCFSQEQDSTTNKLFVEFNDITPPQIIKEKGIFQDNIAPFIALIALVVGWYQFKKQINETRKNLLIQIQKTEKNILKEYNLERTSLLLENISNLLLELKKDNGNFLQGKHITNEYFLYEKRILLLLDTSNNEEKELSDYLLSLTNSTTNSITTQCAIKKIEYMSNNIINNKIKV